jgi:hypothetical protein
MTNRDWINSLSNEQLVKLMRSFHQNNCCMCAGEGQSDDCGRCYERQIEWMQMAHDAERWEELDYRYSFW